MYKILIVDDEKVERNGIKFLLKQTGIEYEVTEAVNGKAALEYINNNQVDIILTDVKMPFMDGIELIENVAALKRNVRYVIFSGCSEFDYAKQAVRLGVSDYILKPVDPKEFQNTIHKVVAEMDEAKLENDIKNKSIEYMNEHILYLLANGSDLNAVEEYNNGLVSLDFINELNRAMLIEFNTDFFGRKGLDFKENIKAFEPVICQYLNLNPSQTLLFFKEDRDTEYYVDKADKIYRYVHNEYNESCFIAVSSKFEGVDGMQTAMEELDTLMENKFYHQTCNVFYSGMKNDATSIIQIDDDTVMKQMKQDIKMKDVSSLRAHFDRFCQKYRNKTDFSQVYIKFLFSNLLKDFYETLPDTDEKELNSEIDTLYRSNDFDTVMELVTKNIDRLEKSFSQNPQMIHKEIEIIKQYIYDHFGEEMSVELLGEMVYMAPSYLSSVFKKETGQNLSKFIKSYRMEKAKDMLENSMSKIIDISNMCGYPNVSYFCSSFREYFGVSPQKFRENGDEGIA